MVLVSYKPILLVNCIAMVMHFLQAGRERETLPYTGEPMRGSAKKYVISQIDDQIVR